MADQDQRRIILRSYVTAREAALIRAGAEEEGISVSEYLRTCAAWVAVEYQGLTVHTRAELLGQLAEHTAPAEA